MAIWLPWYSNEIGKQRWCPWVMTGLERQSPATRFASGDWKFAGGGTKEVRGKNRFSKGLYL